MKQFYKIPIILMLAFAFISSGLTAQISPTYIAGSEQTFRYSGIGNSGRPPLVAGVPTITYNIPTGENRLLIISSYIERNHGTITPNSNWPCDPDGESVNSPLSRLQVTVGGTEADLLDSRNNSFNNPDDEYNARFSTHYFIRYLSDASGLPTGNTTFTFPNLNSPENAGDELIIVIRVFQNANPVPQDLGSNRLTSFSATSVSYTGTAPGSPVGTENTNIMYLGEGYLSQQGNPLTFTANWNQIVNQQITNSNGTTINTGTTPAFTNENDGLRYLSTYRSGLAGNPTFQWTRTGTTSTTQINRAATHIYAILPLARPSVSGTVYRDNDGGNINGGGSGGTWSAATYGALYVNAVKDGVVIATAAVNNSGVFSFPEGGDLVEGDEITFQLSNVSGLVDATQIPGWVTVGESISSGPQQLPADGEFILTIGTANSTDDVTNRFGVTACPAGSAAPLVNATLGNSCNQPTISLTDAHLGTIPANSTLVWFTTSNHAPGTQVTGTGITAASSGTYYAFYYSSGSNCYSPASVPVIVTLDVLDSDNDGIYDKCDLDDDNDGILDADESPNCFYSAIEAGLVSRVISSFNGAGTDPAAGNNIPTLYNLNNSDGTFNFAGTQTVNIGDAIFTIEYPTAVPLTSLSVIQANNGMGTSNRFGTLHGSNNGVSYDLLTNGNGIALNSTTVTFNNGQTIITPYKYYQIRYHGRDASGASGTLILGTNAIHEITSVLSPTYIPSANPKPGVCVGTDPDGIPNHLDLDSDNDGCPDAIEGTGTITTGQLTTASGAISTQSPNQNLGNAVNTTLGSSTYGVPTIAGAGQRAGASQISTVNGCIDSDGDGFADWKDQDDDNDGILDIYECADLNPNIDFSVSGGTTFTMNAPAADLGFIFDIYTLDNSFNLNINGVNLSTQEVDFQFNHLTTKNIRFADGSQYGAGGIPEIWSFSGTSSAPAVRIIIAANGSIAMLGSKFSGGPLEPLELFNGAAFNVIKWNINSANTVIATQSVDGTTYITGHGTGYKKGFCDLDGDGISNELDLDADGDNCPDAIEGAGNFNPTTTASGTISSQTPNINFGIATNPTTGIPTAVGAGQGVGLSKDAVRNECLDTDGDTIVDWQDLDDDNDGILDAVESPNCFYNIGEANQIVSVTSQLNGAGSNPQAGTNIPTLFNGINPDTGTIFNFAGSQTLITGTPIFTIQYPAPVALGNLTVAQAANGMGATAAFGKLYGSNDGVNYTLLTVGNAINIRATSVSFDNTSPTTYLYYQIRYTGTTNSNTTAGTAGTANIHEITSTINIYIPSAGPKPGVCNGLDTDGTPNHLDLDSDGDGCFDALEGDENVLLSQLNTNGSIITATIADIGTSPTDKGVPILVNSGGAADFGGDVGQGIGVSQNANVNECLDSDGDGIPDLIDLDDDNDGILDTLESPSCYSCTLGTTNTWTSYQTYSASGAILPPLVDESETFASQNPETIIATKFPHTDPFGFGIPWYNNMVLKPSNNAFGVIDELGTPPAATQTHSEWHVNMAIWQPSTTTLSVGAPLRIRTNNNGLYSPPANGRVETTKLFAKVNDGTAPMLSASAGIDSNYNEINLGNWNGTSCVILALYMFDQSLLHDNGAIQYWNGTAWVDIPASEVSAMPAIIPGCTNDTDGDGIPNHLDLDSDGDGCPDAIEGAGNFNPTTTASGPIASQTPNINFGEDSDPTTGIPNAVGGGQGIGQSQDGTKNDCINSDGDTLPDWQDLDDDNDGILDTDECSPDLLAVYALNNFATLVTGYTSDNTKFLQLRPSDFGLITPGATNQNRTRDYSSFYGLPPGSIIVTVENGNVHPTANPLNPLTDVFYVSARPGVGNTKVTVSGTLGAYMVVEHGRHYYGNHERGIRFLDGSHLNPTANLIDLASQTTSPGNWESGSAGNYYYVRHTNATTPVESTFTYGLVNAQYSPKRVSVSTDNAVPTEYSTFFIRILPECDTDKDGIPNRLDLDSDNDGCIDAIEGGGTISSSQVTDALGTVSVGFGSTATNQNLGNTVDANGVPTIVNGGQTVGDSQNALVNGCVCYEDPALVSGTTYPVKQGITLLGRAGKVSTGTTNTPSDWPMIRNSAYTALESKTKGFVITRNSEPEGIIDPTKKIAIPIVGMMVFDTDENSGAGCLKIYTGSGTGEGWKCFTTPTCP